MAHLGGIWRVAPPLLASAVALAQAVAHPPRRPSFVRVLDAAGAPLAGAEVTCVGGFPERAGALQVVDEVRVATDVRGRAVVKLLPGRCYVAWANGPKAADGTRSTSAVSGYVSAGALLTLHATRSQPSIAATLRGTEAWRHVGPLRVVAMTAMPGIERAIEPGPDGTFALPGPPFDAVEIRLADGQPLWHGKAAVELALPPPQSVAVLAVDGSGRPLAEARVIHRVGRRSSWRLDGLRSVAEDRMRSLATTDADGRCSVEIPYDGDPLRAVREDMLLFVSAGDRPAVAGGVFGQVRFVSDHRVSRIEGDELRFVCEAVEPLVGSLPSAPAGTVAQLSAVCKLFLQRNGYQHDARLFTTEVRPDGSFSFADVPAELHSCRLSFVAPDGNPWRPPVFAPEAARQLPAETVASDDERDAPFAFGAVELQVMAARGGPARGAVALVSAADRRQVLVRDSVVRVPLDERGQARLRLASGRWVAVVATAEGYGASEFAVDTGDTRVALELAPLATTTVALRDAAGRPVVGARPRLRGTRVRGTDTAVQSLLQGVQRAGRVAWDRLRTDEHGRIVIPFVPVEGVQQRVELRWDSGTSNEFVLAAGAERAVRENH